MFDIDNGAYVLRAQPLHNGHLEVIKYMFSRCRNVLIVLGSANKANDLRNPLPIDMRLTMLKETLADMHMLTDRVKIITLNDWSTEDDYGQAKTWGRYLYYNIVNALNAKTITMFYSDNKDIMLDWVRGTEIEIFVDYCFIDRDAVEDGISATKVRDAILADMVPFLEKFCPPATVMRRGEIFEILQALPPSLPRK